MSCREFEEKIADFATGRLEAHVAAEVGRHLSACDSCLDFAAAVRSLYGVTEAPLPHSSPVRGIPSFPDATHGRVRVARSAVAAALIIGSIIAAFSLGRWDRPRRDESGGAGAGTALASVPLLAVEVTLPSVPAYRVGTWIESREEAELLASFTGRPLLEQVRYPHCPICIGAQQTLDRPEARAALAGFVLCRSDVEAELPGWLEEAIPANPDRFPLPAMRVTEGELETEARVGVSTVESLLELVAEWRALEARRDTDERGPIDAAEFAECSRRLARIAKLVEARDFTEAVRSLDELSRIADRSGTAFASVAAELRTELLDSFERQLAEIERLHSGTAEERRQAVDLARRFREEVRDLPIESRVVAYTE